MSTWANIVKKTTGTQKSQQQVAGTAGSAQVPDYVDKRKLEEEWFLRDRATQASNFESLEKESQTQCRPTWMSLVRPDAPKVLPIFKTEEEMHIWHHSEFNANRKYSDQMYNQRLDEWRVRNNWLLPLSKTTVSQETRDFTYRLQVQQCTLHLSVRDQI